ncbi:DUF2283 domain-containing protein [bacterium]|nr:DUF2283 domain-containing protein [bacterium]
MKKKKPLVSYDEKSDVIYIVSKPGEEEQYVEIAPGVNVELDDRGEVIGIEILNASSFLKPVVRPLIHHMELA